MHAMLWLNCDGKHRTPSRKRFAGVRMLAPLLLHCAGPRVQSEPPRASDRLIEKAELTDRQDAPLLAQTCSPGMSCFGKVVLLPDGEVAETVLKAGAAAAGGAAAGAATAAASKPKPAEKSKSSSGSSKAESKAEPKTKVEPAPKKKCIPEGGDAGPGRFKPYRKPGIWIRCKWDCDGVKEYRTFDAAIEEDCWFPLTIP